MTRRLLVTGGAGFIGGHLVRRLLDAGDKVVVLDDFSASSDPSLADHPGLSVVVGDVRCAADVRLLRDHLTRLGCPDLPVIAKIEKPEAVERIDEILAEVQGLMVARGDLGVEMQLERLPVIQKELI